jgi:hypothetical protein
MPTVILLAHWILLEITLVAIFGWIKLCELKDIGHYRLLKKY